MRYGRVALTLAALTLTGAYLGLMAQERRDPWPPRPVVPPDAEEQQEPPGRPVLPPPAAVDLPLPSPLPPGNLDAAPMPPPAPVEPPPISLPTKPALVDPPSKEFPKKVDLSLPPPVPPGFEVIAPPLPTPKPAELPTVPRREEKMDVLPPPAPVGTLETPLPKDLPKPAFPKDDFPKMVLPPAPVETPRISGPAKSPGGIVPEAPYPTPLEKGIEKVADKHDRPLPFRLVNPVRKASGTTPGLVGPGTVAPLLVSPLPGSGGPDASIAHSSPIATTIGGIVVEKRGPGHIKHTDPAAYVITVRNPTASLVQHVRIEDEVPPTVKILGCEPEPVILGNKVLWVLPQLGPGEEKVLRITLQAPQPGELMTAARAFVPVSSSEVRTMIHPGAFLASPTPGALPTPGTLPALEAGLQVQVKAPPTAGLGASVPFELIIQNAGRVPLGKLYVQAKMSEGLGHPEGREVEVDLKGLAAGVRETLKLPLKAIKGGPQFLDVLVRSADGQKAAARATVLIGDGTLKVRLGEVPRALAGREAEVLVEVTNYQAQGARNLIVVDTLPEGADFVMASDRGLYREDSRSIHWLIDYLPPGETKNLRLKILPRRPGDYHHELSARSETKDEARLAGVLKVEGLAELALEVKNQDSALELGKETFYEIQVLNRGSEAATGVQVAAAIPEGMAAHHAHGPTPYKVDGRNLVFQPVSSLPPGEKLKYVLGMTGQKEGDQRLRVQAASDQVRGILREERMLVYRDN